MKRLFDCDTAKRSIIAQDRKFDLLEMAAVFEDESRIDIEDTRENYGEERRVAVGRALGRIFTVVYTLREPVTWLITAWPANRKERDRYERR